MSASLRARSTFSCTSASARRRAASTRSSASRWSFTASWLRRRLGLGAGARLGLLRDAVGEPADPIL